MLERGSMDSKVGNEKFRHVVTFSPNRFTCGVLS